MYPHFGAIIGNPRINTTKLLSYNICHHNCYWNKILTLEITLIIMESYLLDVWNINEFKMKLHYYMLFMSFGWYFQFFSLNYYFFLNNWNKIFLQINCKHIAHHHRIVLVKNRKIQLCNLKKVPSIWRKYFHYC